LRLGGRCAIIELSERDPWSSTLPTYPSQEWLESWAALANGSPEFRSAGAGWSGAVGLVIEADDQSGASETVFMRLEGQDGSWAHVAFGGDPDVVAGTVFTLRAPYPCWKQVIKQELHPMRGVLQGKLRIVGHLPTVLTWVRAITVLAQLAGSVETRFIDEAPAADATAERGT
jgi:putative sterol carrier protein